MGKKRGHKGEGLLEIARMGKNHHESGRWKQGRKAKKKKKKKMLMNAMRSGVVVVGAMAFGYLTLQLGFRPFLEKAQDALHSSAAAHPIDESPNLPELPEIPKILHNE
ncbi:hypothetical protein U1Q18_030080 [Sarracenia purpurea var. burkii]